MSKRAVGILVATIALVLVAAVSLPAAAQTFDDAFAAYERGDYAAAYRGFRPIAERGDARAQYYLGQLYRSGLGVPQDFAGAARWYGRAAAQGDARAQTALAYQYHVGEGVAQDYGEALRWYRRAADRGDALAAYNIGTMHFSGQGVPKDYVQAERWYRVAAGRGSHRAEYNLGYMFEHGTGVRRDYAEAGRWYRRAAESGHTKAQHQLARLYEFGWGVRQDYAEAAKWYRRAADRGLADAQNSLGTLYSHGQGVKRDHAAAAHWFRRAAEQGDAMAQSNLGFRYEHGEGVPQSYEEAMRWYRRAAAQGNAIARNSIGDMYNLGRGVRQDRAEAARWYRLAAGQGLPLAQYNLGRLYERGAGVPRDFVRAYKWFSLAAARASAREAQLRGYAVQDRNRVAARLTQAQLARAQRLTREWRPGRDAKPPARPPAGDGPDRKTVAAAQHALAELGYDPGPADGVMGPRTRAALRAFQASAGLPADGRLSKKTAEALVAAFVAAKAAPAGTGKARRPIELAGAGSGFRVGAAGHILTNAHVVRGCREVRVPPAPHMKFRRVAVAARNDAADLALLEGPAGGRSAAFRRGRGIRPGAGVVVAGYPLHGMLAAGVNVSIGSVSALAGPGNDNRLIQISAPVQPGNSGGPVLDYAGNIVGVVVARLDAAKTARATGSLPQNVNFAVSAGTARAFLDAEGVAYATAPSVEKRAPEDVAAAARKFTVLVECWK
ncbi:MAG: trypsin-like peptidase domain-containing protein [Rhodospirillaceae bacterium]|nr:trypsin-like peptidase domain-containing protein [Rhodospirillaceae bacterium]